MNTELFVYSEMNLIQQLETAIYKQGFYTVQFYTENGLLAKKQTEMVSEFYLYPSGGTLRDSNFNLVFYDSQFDTYRGFVPPHLKRK